MTDTESNTLQHFDQYQLEVIDVMKENASLKCELSKLTFEVAELSRTNESLTQTLSTRESDMDLLSSQAIRYVKETAEMLKTLQHEATDRKKMSEIQYELDICTSCKRSLERDCMLQNNENQRLVCLNGQLSQELKTLKHTLADNTASSCPRN
jgi:hypothetical protein